jgi:hypothetical protein
MDHPVADEGVVLPSRFELRVRSIAIIRAMQAVRDASRDREVEIVLAVNRREIAERWGLIACPSAIAASM